MTIIPKISVIVPVYNSEKYIKRALDSLVAQTFEDFEVIIVNDGSTDTSVDIIKEFCEKYTQFRCICIDNSGVSEARNVGIRSARGKYLAFVDSDDFVSPHFLQVLYDLIESTRADIACCNYYVHWPKYNLSVPKPFALSSRVCEADKLLNKIIKDFSIHFYLWNKLWRRSLFTENNIVLPKMCFEDIVVSTRLFYNAKKIAVSSVPLYYYTQNTDSLVNTMTMRKFNDYILAFTSIRNFLESRQDYKKYRLSHSLFGVRIIITNVKLLFNIHSKRESLGNIFKDFKTSLKKILYAISNRFEFDKKIEEFLNQK